MKKLILRAGKFVQRHSGKVAASAVVVVAGVVTVHAQTDISSTITSVNGYWTTAETLAIGILLFVLGRRVVKKI